VESSAKQLTAAGTVPFTRADLIKRVQRKAPNYGENSINPIIQGLTDNLRGGAPGAVGKNILHSVGRGQFMLADRNEIDKKASLKKPPKSAKRPSSYKVSGEAKSPEMAIGRYQFSKVCDIEPLRNSAGEILELLPQERYENVQKLPLNNYGTGPYCKFKIPRNINDSGVYAIVVDDDVKYIGECVNLSSRYNMGYGNISPRNCFVGGQETNCRINNLILSAAVSGKNISLCFLKADNYKSIEAELRCQVHLDWNRV